MSKVLSIAVAAIMLLCGVANASVLGDLAAKMSVGTFQEITGTNFNYNGYTAGIFTTPEFPNCSVGGSITEFATHAGYDQSRQQVQFYGRSHDGSCYGGRFIQYDIATDTWSKLSWPTSFSTEYDNLAAEHEWDQWNAVRESDGLHLVWVGGKAIAYNPATQTWSRAGGQADPGTVHGESTNSFRYFPAMGKFVLCNGSYGCWTLNPANNFSNDTTAAWECILKGATNYGCTADKQSIFDGDTSGYNTLSAVSGNYMYLALQHGFGRIGVTGLWTKLTNCPVECQLNTATMQADPVSGNIVLLAQGQIYEFNVSTLSWSGPFNVSVPAAFRSRSDAYGVAAVKLTSYGVIMFMQYRGPSDYGVYIYKHGQSAIDTTPPSDPANLAATATTSTQINLTWTSSTDNVAIAGYNLERCAGTSCVNFVQVATPSSNSFADSGLSASTLYRYRVRARDTTGNLSGYSNIAQATTPSSGGSDFATRCAAAQAAGGRCFSFDSNADLKPTGSTGVWGANYGSFNNSSVSGGVYETNNLDGTCGSGHNYGCPQIASDFTASGAGSLKFTQPAGPGSAGDAAGQWFANFSSDLGTQFGANSEFYVQWRQRFDSNFVNNIYTGLSHGWKQVIVGTGDVQGQCPTNGINSTNCPTSNTILEQVMENTEFRQYPQTYHYLPSSSQPPYSGPGGLSYTDSHLSYQNMRPDPYCLYDQQAASTSGGPPYDHNFPPYGNCFRYVADEWMTFKMHISLGAISGDGTVYNNSVFEAWAGREGQALVPIVRYAGDLVRWSGGAYEYKYGKIWLLPEPYTKDTTQTHPVAHTWYDELIISTADIADPSGAPASGDTQAPAIVITTPTTSATYSTTSNSIDLSGTCTDNVACTQVTWSNNRGGSGTASLATGWTAAGITLQAGDNVITVGAFDAAGNASTDSITVTYVTPTPAAAGLKIGSGSGAQIGSGSGIKVGP